MSADAGLMSSREYEREAEASRIRLAGNLRNLSDRLTPGQVFDEMLTYTKAGGGTFLTAFTNAARHNPIPSLLIGAGLMMFLSEKTGLNTMMRDQSNGHDRDGNGAGALNGDRGAGSNGHGPNPIVSAAEKALNMARSAAGGAYDGARKGAANAGAAVGGAAAGVGAAVADAADSARSAAAGVGAGLTDAAGNVMHTVGDVGGAVRNAAGAVGGRIGDAASRVPNGLSQTADRLMSRVGEQPLIAGTVGLAIGAIIAAALPETEAEHELLGEASDTVKAAVGELAADEMEQAKSAAVNFVAEVTSEVGKVAERQGVSPENAAVVVHNATDRIKDAIGMPSPTETKAGDSERKATPASGAPELGARKQGD